MLFSGVACLTMDLVSVDLAKQGSLRPMLSQAWLHLNF